MRVLLKLSTFVASSVIARVALGAGLAGGALVIGPQIAVPSSTSQEKNITQERLASSILSAHLTRRDADALSLYIQESKVTASGAVAFDEFGRSVAISGDTAVVGSDKENGYRGAAYVFVRSGSTWNLQQRLVAADAQPDDNFGWSVAVSGNTIVVGALDVNGVDQGAAYVFVRTGSTWTQQQKLTSDGSLNDQFGGSVSVDLDTVVVGAPGDASSRGAAYVYVRSGSVWTQQQKLQAVDGASGDEFGWSVAVSGETAVIGAYRDDQGRGSAYAFTRSGSFWSQQQKLQAADGAALDQFGYSVGLNGDLAIVGAVGDSDAGTESGSAYIFFRNAGWGQEQKLTASNAAANDRFGGSVSISGSTAVVGANGDDEGTNVDIGSAFIYARSGSSWSLDQKLTASDGSIGDNFGSAVSISGGSVIVGAYMDDNGSFQDQGSAYFFSSNTQTTPTPTPTPATPTPTPTPATPTPTPTPATPTPTPTPATPTPTPATPTPTPAPTGLEGDIAPRPSGDGLVLSNDIVQIRRFVVGLDAPLLDPNEFQRADTAPLATLGDGSITAGDTIQLRRYVTGLDALRPAGGPTGGALAGTGSLLQVMSDFLFGTEVRASSNSGRRGTRISVPLEIVSGGSEAAVSLSLEYDSERLSAPIVELPEGSPADTALTVNADQPGMLGILLDSESVVGSSNRLVMLSFLVNEDAPDGETPLRLTSTLAKRYIADTNGNSLPSRFVDGKIMITGSAAENVSLTGRLISPDGRGIRNATITAFGPDGTMVTAVSSGLGHYQLNGLELGGSYRLSVTSKRYRFDSHVVQITSAVTLDLMAQE